MRLLQWLLFLVVVGILLSEKYAPIFFFVGAVIALFLIGALFEKRIERAFLARIAQAGGNPDTLNGQALYEGLKYEYELLRPIGRFSTYTFTLQVIAKKSGSFRVSRKNWIVRSNQTRNVLTGDSAFDHDFMIESETPEYASAIFSIPENRAAIRNIMTHGYTFIEQVGTKLKAICIRLTTDDPCSDIITSVIPRLASLGGVDQNLLATAPSQPKHESIISTSSVTIWNPNAIVIWSLILTPAFGSYLLMLNWKTLGQPDKAASSQDWFHASLVILLIYILAITFMPHSKSAELSGYVMGLCLLAWYFFVARPQVKFVKEKFGSDYSKKPWGRALFAGYVAFMCYVAVVIVLSDQTSHGSQAERAPKTTHSLPLH